MRSVSTGSNVSKHAAILEYNNVVKVGAYVGQGSVSGGIVTNNRCGKSKPVSYEMWSEMKLLIRANKCKRSSRLKRFFLNWG